MDGQYSDGLIISICCLQLLVVEIVSNNCSYSSTNNHFCYCCVGIENLTSLIQILLNTLFYNYLLSNLLFIIIIGFFIAIYCADNVIGNDMQIIMTTV